MEPGAEDRAVPVPHLLPLVGALRLLPVFERVVYHREVGAEAGERAADAGCFQTAALVGRPLVGCGLVPLKLGFQPVAVGADDVPALAGVVQREVVAVAGQDDLLGGEHLQESGWSPLAGQDALAVARWQSPNLPAALACRCVPELVAEQARVPGTGGRRWTAGFGGVVVACAGRVDVAARQRRGHVAGADPPSHLLGIGATDLSDTAEGSAASAGEGGGGVGVRRRLVLKPHHGVDTQTRQLTTCPLGMQHSAMAVLASTVPLGCLRRGRAELVPLVTHRFARCAARCTARARR